MRWLKSYELFLTTSFSTSLELLTCDVKLDFKMSLKQKKKRNIEEIGPKNRNNPKDKGSKVYFNLFLIMFFFFWKDNICLIKLFYVY